MLEILADRALFAKLGSMIPSYPWLVPIAMIASGLLLVLRSMSESPAEQHHRVAAQHTSKMDRLQAFLDDAEATNQGINRRLARLEYRLALAEAKEVARRRQALDRGRERGRIEDARVSATFAELHRFASLDDSHVQWAAPWEVSFLIDRGPHSL